MNLVVLTTQNHQQHKGKKKKKHLNLNSAFSSGGILPTDMRDCTILT